MQLEESARRKRKRSPTRMPLGHDAASSTGAARRYEDRASEHLRRLGLKPAKTARAAIRPSWTRGRPRQVGGCPRRPALDIAVPHFFFFEGDSTRDENVPARAPKAYSEENRG